MIGNNLNEYTYTSESPLNVEIPPLVSTNNSTISWF